MGGVSPGTLSVDTFVGSVYWLHDGALNQGGTGFATWVASDYPGTAGYTQVYDDESYPTAYGSNVLDGAEFYTHPGPPQITVHLGQPSLNPLALVDAPSETSRPGGSVALVVQFRDYARFRPDAGNPADNIFVTLGKVTWNINGSATGGVLNGGSTISQPTLDDSSEWPFWTTTRHAVNTAR